MSPHVTVMLTVYWYRVRLLKSKSVAFIIMRKNKSPAGVGFFYKGNLDNFLTTARARSTVHQIRSGASFYHRWQILASPYTSASRRARTVASGSVVSETRLREFISVRRLVNATESRTRMHSFV